MLLEIQEEGEFQQALADLLDNFDDKVESVAKVAKTLEAEAGVYTAQAKRIMEEAKPFLDAAQARQNHAELLKKYLLAEMEAMSRNKVQGKLLAIGIQKSSPACDITDEILIPGEYKEISFKVDRRAIIERWKETGAQTPGAVVTQSNHIRIRP
jgi:hypothetical protein